MIIIISIIINNILIINLQGAYGGGRIADSMMCAGQAGKDSCQVKKNKMINFSFSSILSFSIA